MTQEELIQSICERVQAEYDEGCYISKETVSDIAMDEFDEAGGCEAFDVDEEDKFDFVVDELIASISINL